MVSEFAVVTRYVVQWPDGSYEGLRGRRKLFLKGARLFTRKHDAVYASGARGAVMPVTVTIEPELTGYDGFQPSRDN